MLRSSEKSSGYCANIDFVVGLICFYERSKDFLLLGLFLFFLVKPVDPTLLVFACGLDCGQ